MSKKTIEMLLKLNDLANSIGEPSWCVAPQEDKKNGVSASASFDRLARSAKTTFNVRVGSKHGEAMKTIETTKCRPIIFDGESVRAILAGNKTQTRRVVKFDCAGYSRVKMKMIVDGEFAGQVRVVGQLGGCDCRKCREDFIIACPYGVVGDRLWVRETCRYEIGNDVLVRRREDLSSAIAPTDADREHICNKLKARAWSIGRWQRAMPRWASRITLEITEVRVQRLQEISEADAMSEGCKATHHGDGSSAADAFAYRWNIINEKRGYSWESNPWVWAISFKSVEVDQ